MFDNKYVIPQIYQMMEENGYTNAQGSSYLWLNEMEWIPIEKIIEFGRERHGNKTLIPFAFTGGGDKWVWVFEENNEVCSIGLCENAEPTGIYYAKNMEDAILRQVIEYVADSNFYIDKEYAESYQISEEELIRKLQDWKNRFEGIINAQYIDVLNSLTKLKIKKTKCQYGEWYALLNIEEQNELIDKYIKFDMIDKEFELQKNEEEYDEFYACAIRVKEVLNKTEKDNINENELIEISKYNCPNEIMLLNGLSIWRG